MDIRGSHDRLDRRDRLAARDRARHRRWPTRSDWWRAPMADKRALITGHHRARTARTSPSCCSRRATRSTAWCAARRARRSSASTHIRDRINLHTGDLLDQRSLTDVMREAEPHGDLQPRRDVVRGRVVEPAGPDGRVHRHRRHAHARGDARRGARGPLLPGVVERDVRQGARDPADGGRRRSTRARRTAWRRSTATSSRSTTASPTTCTRRPGSSSTTSRRAAGSSS